ncbi:hypothetical protein FRC03_007470 [Tulasnella sp. 419]|nr:hypothetical protein FRC03_007470 [Tulasnella sp. 419]
MQKCTDHFSSQLSKEPGDGKPSEIQLVLHSQLYVKPFYGRLGYVEEGDEFDEDGAPHQKMILRLKSSD